MRIYVEFDSLEEFQAYGSGVYSNVPVPTPPPAIPPAAVTEDAAPPQKRTRRTKAEMEAALAAAQTKNPAPHAAAPASAAETHTAATGGEFDDSPTEVDEFDTPVAPATPTMSDEEHKGLVRAALVGYQDRMTDAGKDLEAARGVVMALLKKHGDADKLGALKRDKYDAVIKAANTAK